MYLATSRSLTPRRSPWLSSEVKSVCGTCSIQASRKTARTRGGLQVFVDFDLLAELDFEGLIDGQTQIRLSAPHPTAGRKCKRFAVSLSLGKMGATMRALFRFSLALLLCCCFVLLVPQALRTQGGHNEASKRKTTRTRVVLLGTGTPVPDPDR